MSVDFATYLFQQIIWQGLILVGPFLGAAIAIGLTVSLIQTVTSLQDQTLSFVPKVVGILGLIWALVPWILQTLVGMVSELWAYIPQMAP
ncbi:MAG: flagellar biosynthetic protein FliQ [Opitutales bacterium]